MQFYLHGQFAAEVAGALGTAGHQTHDQAELLEGMAAAPPDQRGLLAAIAARQWMLFTDSRRLVQSVYDDRLPGPPIMVLMVGAVLPADQQDAVRRLFERYPRLSGGRLYTITPGRVKVRQLPQVRRGE